MIRLKNILPKKNDPVWVVPSGAMVEGDLSTPRSLRIDGQVVGNIQAAERLLIGATGEVTGDIEGNYVLVQGIVRGNVQARSKVHIAATATIEGVVQAPESDIREGAILQAPDIPAAVAPLPVTQHVVTATARQAPASAVPQQDKSEFIEKIWTPVRPVNNNTWF